MLMRAWDKTRLSTVARKLVSPSGRFEGCELLLIRGRVLMVEHPSAGHAYELCAADEGEVSATEGEPYTMLDGKEHYAFFNFVMACRK